MRCKFCQSTKDLIQVHQTTDTIILCRDVKPCINRAHDKMRMQVYVNRNREAKGL